MSPIEQLEQSIQILLEKYQQLQKDNVLLREQLKDQREEIIRSHSEIQSLQTENRRLTMVTAASGDFETRKKAYRLLTQMIAQIDKAIDDLSSEPTPRTKDASLLIDGADSAGADTDEKGVE